MLFLYIFERVIWEPLGYATRVKPSYAHVVNAGLKVVAKGVKDSSVGARSPPQGRGGGTGYRALIYICILIRSERAEFGT